MEIVSIDFLVALASIVVIDLVLAGDNAIVIALAARNVPRHLQRRAIIAGTAGAVIVRSSMTLAVVWLLRIPGLQLVGGLLLVFIAYKLLRPEEQEAGGHRVAAGASSFWGAMRTIVVADAIMGVDNVLGVAGAAHGSFLLVVLGLLISIPIVIWGSTLVLHLVERHPSIVYVGAGVLAWTAVSMMTSEPLLSDALAAYRPAGPLLYALVIFAVLGSGFVANHHRLESRISDRVTRLGRRREQPAAAQVSLGEHDMMKILVPVDGSASSMYAARHISTELLRDPAMEIHLLAVQGRFSRHIAQFLNHKDLERFYREEAEKKLTAVREFFDRQDIPYIAHAEVGHKAEIITDMAKRLGCHHIVMGTARKNSLTRMIEASVTHRVLELTTVPVEVIAGDAVSRLERYGIPAAIGAGIMLLLAIDD